ncbi:MAG: Acetyltransferase family [Candidatus Levybacteria bacterium]|nr:Acetyltransferase family [Candidatus Levybacteria bacterium]
MENESKLFTEKGKENLSVKKTYFLNMEEAIPLFRAAYNGLAPWYEYYTKERVNSLLSKYQNMENFQTFVAKADNNVLGMAITTKGRQDGLSDSLFLQEIFVDPNYQQSSYKVGSNLLKRIIQDATTNGYKAIQLQTDIRDTQAVKLYKKFAFIEEQNPQEKRVTQRTFTRSLDNSIEIVSAPLAELPNDLNGSSIFLNQKELKGYLFSQCVQPDKDEDPAIFQGTLDLITKKALGDKLIQKQFYNQIVNNRSAEVQIKFLSLSRPDMEQLNKFTRFILSIQRLSKSKMKGDEVNVLIKKCFALKDPKERLNVVCFVCASYEKAFDKVSTDAKTNRLKFFSDDVRDLEKTIEILEGQAKVTLFLADTDYEIYPIEKSQDNLLNYQKQYRELRDFCQKKFNPRFVRILPWSRFQSRFDDIYSSNLQKALPLSIDLANKDNNENFFPRKNIKQVAVYAAQAATLPMNSVLLIMEPAKFNKDYDLLFQKQTSIPKLPKLEIFDVDSYKKWTNEAFVERTE